MERMTAAEFLASYEIGRDGRGRPKRDPEAGAAAPTRAAAGRGSRQTATGSPGHARANGSAPDGAPTQHGPAAGGNPAKRRNKFGAIRTAYTSPLNGPRVYDSKAEAARAAYLDQRWLAGEILHWLPQVRFWLGETPEGEPMNYTADFLVWGPDGVEVEDVKGVPTPDYKLRRSLMWQRRKILVKEIR